MNEPPTSIAIAVVQHEAKFLIGQRPAHAALPGYWEFPGGKVEAGESPEDAAIRECLEETGLVVRILFAYPEHVQQYDHGRVKLHFFACAPLDANREPLPPYRWVLQNELRQYQFPEGNRGLLQLLSHYA